MDLDDGMFVRGEASYHELDGTTLTNGIMIQQNLLKQMVLQVRCCTQEYQ